ncbi:MAG TPA: AMP-binding protein [Steroidobacteraceae bacterium]|nr:AMP-binding protein [Steroidobacteraceae bacterium]
MAPGAAADLAPREVLALYRPHAGTVASFLAARVEVTPDKPVLLVGGRTWTYRELEEGSVRLAHMLARRGIEHGDRIVLVAVNTDLSVVLFLAAARLGAIFVPLNPASTHAELSYLLRHTRPALIVAQAEELARVTDIARELERAPALLPLAELDAGEGGARAVIAGMKAVDPADAPLPSVSAEDPLVVIYTSGTTGFPKGVVHTQRTYLLAAEGFVERLHLQPSDRLLTVLPFYHINALFYSLGGAIAAGGALVTAPRFSATTFWNLAADSGATEFNILAAVGNILMNRDRSEYNAAHRVRKIYGGPISERMYQVFREEFHIPTLIEGYGMSEIPGACCTPFAGLHKPGSIGLPARHPLYQEDFAQMRIVDDEGRDVPTGATGELLVRTPMMFKEYLDDPVQTAAAFRDGWFLTGDLARRDEDGYLYFVARKKDIIRRRGENIAGAELDRVISDHPELLEAAAIGVPSELGEEEILIVVVPRPQANPRAEDIIAWCRERLAPMKVPRFVAFAESLPHTPSHRVAKHRLKADTALLKRMIDTQRAP